MIPSKAINLIVDLWPMLLLFIIVVTSLRITYLVTNHKRFILYKELLSLCSILYAILLFELVTSNDFESYSHNFIPFKEMFRYSLFSRLFYRNVIGNIILFMPFGYFISYYCKINRFYINLLLSFITSFSIEIIQACIGRSFDIDDIILNVLGGFLGYIVYLVSTKILYRFSNKVKNGLLLNFLCIIIITVLVLIILSLYGVIL